MMKTLARQFPKTASKRTTIKGFTLIELLTVIAIIGILAAIIIPTVGKVRDSAKKAQCVSNLKQIGMCIGLYLNENKDMMPDSVHKPDPTKDNFIGWGEYTAPLTKLTRSTATIQKEAFNDPKANHIFNCPSDINFFRTYVANAQFMIQRQSNPTKTMRYSRIPSPSTKIIITDSEPTPGALTGDPGPFAVNDDASNYLTKIGSRHGGKANALYADFHVNTIDRTQIEYTKSLSNRQ